MTSKPTVPMTEEDVLLAFTAEPDHGRATLEDYVRRYPPHAEAITSLAVDLMLAPQRDQNSCSPTDTAVDHAWQAFSAVAIPLETKSAGAAYNLIGALPNKDFRALAVRVGANTLFLSQLRDRAIDLATIPPRFIEHLAKELSVTVAAVMEDFGRPPSAVATSERFKAEVKPRAGDRITFEQAIQNSNLDPDQQRKLKEFMD